MSDAPDALEDPWQVADLDLDGYLTAVGVNAGDVAIPGLIALGQLHEAHVRTFTFDNIDVLLDQHPGVDLAAVQGTFLGRGRGGYCFQHATLFAAALQRLGYRVRRQLGRVETGTGVVGARTHVTVAVLLGERWWLCDPGFGMSLLRPIPMVDGAEAEHHGWRSRVIAAPVGLGGADAFQLLRQRDGGWALLHTVDALPVHPVDLVAGHHHTSTFPDSSFRHRLLVARYLPDRHVTLNHAHVTIRRAGEPTEHRVLGPGEWQDWLEPLGVALTDDERARLVARVASLR